ncbi:hypothetical protein ADILRU_0852 [Leifsonia rubra CMS 76R]|nr:hypothetical protein ADILRU_0852 [Leifsonia rubra CMS 76R]
MVQRRRSCPAAMFAGTTRTGNGALAPAVLWVGARTVRGQAFG